MQNYLNEDIANLCNQPLKTTKTLYANGYNTVGDIAKATKKDLLAVKGIGKRTVSLLENELDDRGLSFGMTDEDLDKKGAFKDIDFFKALVIENVRNGNDETAVSTAIHQYEKAALYINSELN